MSRFCTVAIVALFVAQAAFAVDYTYTGGFSGSDLWNNPASWGGVGFPNSASDTAYFEGRLAQKVGTEAGGQNPFMVSNITLGNGLARAAIITLGTYAGCPGLEIAAGATILKRDATADVINCAISLDGATTVTSATTGGNLTFRGGITGLGSFTKTGPGYVTFDVTPNTYTGLTYLANGGRLYLNGSSGTQFIGTGGLKIAGRLQYGNGAGYGDHIADTCPVELAAGGEFVPSGAAETVGVATLTGNFTLWGAYVTDAGVHFANSSAATWTPGAMITLTAYAKTIDQVMPKYYFGTDNTGLTAAQLAQIQFVDEDASGNLTTTYGAMLAPDGQVVPVPEPMTISLLVVGGLALLRRKA